MVQHLLSLLVVIAPTIAAADAAKDAASALEPYFSLWPTMRDDPASRATSTSLPDGAACDAVIAKARAAGLKDDARIYARYIGGWNEAEYDEQRQVYISLADAATVCARWKQMVLIMPAAAKQHATAQTRYVYSLDKPENLDSADDFLKKGKECLDITDQALAAGAPADHKVKIRDEMITLAEGRTKHCQGMIDWATELAPKIKARRAADRAQRAAPYKALGVAGAKLELFMEYDDVYWRGGKDCQRITDLKQVAKAKALFHWLENSDGTHTIRKYTFNGNKVSGPVSKTYRTSGAAQRGCR